MIIRQNGLRVLGTRAVGLLLLFFAAMNALGGIALLLWSLFSNDITESTIAGMAVSFIQALTLSWFAAFLLWMYPDIEIRPDSIRLRFLVFQREIPLENIVRFTERSQSGIRALLLKRGETLLNLVYGYFFYKIADQGVVMLSVEEKSLEVLKDYLMRSIPL